MGSVLYKLNPVHFTIQRFLTIRFNIILLSTHSSLKWFLLSGVPSKILLYISDPPLHILPMYFSLPWAIQYFLKIICFDASLYAFFSLNPKLSPHYYFSSTPSLSRTKFHSHAKYQVKLQIFVHFHFVFRDFLKKLEWNFMNYVEAGICMYVERNSLSVWWLRLKTFNAVRDVHRWRM
jgi:hypothetical protein